MTKIRILLLLLLAVVSQQIFAQERVVTGTVISAEDEQPVIGAMVAIKGDESRGVATDLNGEFSIALRPGDDRLVISYVGMRTRYARVDNKSNVRILLFPESTALQEVVVTGYGDFTRSSFTGSASTVKGDVLKDIPVVSVEQKLQGMTSGVSITSSSGQPGANQSIRIRGLGSFSASKEPLFVIDGVPVTSGSLSSGGADAAYMNNSKTNIMSTLNPSDIENITVIKDAAAASLYGSRAANGVILITTKKGKAGKAQVSVNLSGGFSNSAVDYRPTLNGDQRYELLYEGLVNYAQDEDMASPEEYAQAEIGKYAYKPSLGYTDWRKELLRTAVQQNYEASVSGGNENTTYYASLGYNSQEGLARNSFLDRYSARVNVTQKVGKYGEAGANLMFTQMNQEMNEERGSAINPFYCVAVTMNPSMTVRNEKGEYVGAYPGTTLNPLRDILLDYNRTRMTRVFATGFAAVEPLPGLKLKETLSYDYTIQKDSRYYNPLSSAGPKSSSVAQSAKGFIEYGKLLSSTSLSYVHTFDDVHHLDLMAAYEAESYQTDKANGERWNLPDVPGLTEPDNGSVLNSFISSTQAYRMLSLVSRVNYDFDNRYYVGGSYRRDGSSRLSPENRWGNFWSVSGMWHMSREAFMEPVAPVLTDVKLRASYGVNGNQPGALYGFMGLYSFDKSYQGGLGMVETSLPNPDLGWEKNYNMNLGLDLGFINRIFISAEYYNRDTKDLLYNLPISGTTGFTSYLSNVGQLNNKGVEIELRTMNFVDKDFNWTTIFNLSHNKNKIVSLNGQLDQSIEGTWFIHKVGLPYNMYYVKEFAGVDPLTGSAWYFKNTELEDGTRDRTLTTNAAEAESIPYKSVDPKISGGLTNILNYKWFDLSFTLTYSLGGYSFDKAGTYIENGTQNIYGLRYNLPETALNRWQNPGDVTDVPRFVYGELSGVTNSSRYIHSTDHLRLKSLTMGVTLPESWTRKLMVEKARVYFSGSNLLTWAKWNKYDPEVPVNGEVFCDAPVMRTFNFGIQLTL